MLNEDRTLGSYNPEPYEIALEQDLENDPGFQEVYNDGHFSLFKKI